MRRYFYTASVPHDFFGFSFCIPHKDLGCGKVRLHTWYRRRSGIATASSRCKHSSVSCKLPKPSIPYPQRAHRPTREIHSPAPASAVSVSSDHMILLAPRSTTISTLSSLPDQTPDGDHSMAGWPVEVSYPWQTSIFSDFYR